MDIHAVRPRSPRSASINHPEFRQPDADTMYHQREQRHLRLLPYALLVVAAQGCTLNHAAYIKQMDKLDGASYSRIHVGQVQNFTAVKLHVYDRQFEHEVSSVDDPKVQAQFSNQGAVAYYSDNVTGKAFKFSFKPRPSYLHSDWDKYAVLDASDHSMPVNYVSIGAHEDFIARIVDNGSTILYRDAALPETVFRQQPLPHDVHPTWDGYFVTDDTKLHMFRSQTTGRYRLAWVDARTRAIKTFDFQPLVFGVQSSKYATYRGVGYVPQLREWFVYDFVPTQKLLCFDLARAHDVAANDASRATTQAALRAIVLALGGYTTTTFSGVGQSTYGGYYAGQQLSVTGSTSYSGYAETYDYRYLAAGTIDLLDTIFKGRSTVEQIQVAMQQQACGFDTEVGSSQARISGRR